MVLNLYHVLKGMPFELTIHNVGHVDSVGNVIFLAGAKRYASKNAVFLFHGVGFNNPANRRIEEKEARQLFGWYIKRKARMGNIIAQNTYYRRKEIAELFKEAQTKDAAFAFSKGFIHDVRDFQIPPNCPVISLAFQRQPPQYQA